MSLEVDKYLLEMMREEDDRILMQGTDISDEIIDHMCGWNESKGVFETDQGLLFPQPIKQID